MKIYFKSIASCLCLIIFLSCSGDDNGSQDIESANFSVNGEPESFTELNSYLLIEEQNKIIISLSDDGNTSIGLETPIPNEYPSTFNLESEGTVIAIWNDNGKVYTVDNDDENSVLSITILGIIDNRINGTFNFSATENDGTEVVTLDSGFFTNVPSLN